MFFYLSYALLGESGCGKTTLLKCLIGILSIDNGKINIFGDKTDHKYSSYRINLKELGFMPQVGCFFLSFLELNSKSF